ncbi:MAG: hypothetical protein J2P57_21340 [Acidimicrobiaceae bacterium]|nr:hypothetical protein [Acidimicrobiaceae bacterium]
MTIDQSVEQRLKALEDRAAGRAAAPDPTAPLWMQNVAYPAGVDRELLSAIWPQREGIIRVNDLRVTQRGAGANLSVDVAPGSCLIEGTDTPNQGSYLQTFMDVTNVPLEPAPAAGQQRYDLIIIQVQDDGVLGSITGPRGQIRVVTGQTSPSGAPLPIQPPSSFLLATVGPITSTTAQVTDSMIVERRSTASLNGSLIASYQVPTGELGVEVDFDDLPQNYTHLIITASTMQQPGSNPYWVWAWINHSTDNYYYADHMGITMSWAATSGNAWNPVYQTTTSWYAAVTIGDGWTTPWMIVLPYYSDPNQVKGGFSIYGSYGATRYFGVASLLRWAAGAIHSLSFWGGVYFYQGSRIEVRGI